MADRRSLGILVFVFGGITAAVMLIAAPALFQSETITNWQPVLFGLAAMILAQTPNGLVGLFRMPDWSGLAARAGWRQDRRRARERYAHTILTHPAITER